MKVNRTTSIAPLTRTVAASAPMTRDNEHRILGRRVAAQGCPLSLRVAVDAAGDTQAALSQGEGDR